MSTVISRLRGMCKMFTFLVLCCAILQELISLIITVRLFHFWNMKDDFVSQYFKGLIFLPGLAITSFLYDLFWYLYCIGAYCCYVGGRPSRNLLLRRLFHGALELLCCGLVLMIVSLVGYIRWDSEYKDAVHAVDLCVSKGHCDSKHALGRLIRIFNGSYYVGIGCGTGDTKSFNYEGNHAIELPLFRSHESLSCMVHRYRVDRISLAGNLAINQGILCIFLIVHVMVVKIEWIMCRHEMGKKDDPFLTWYHRHEIHANWKRQWVTRYRRVLHLKNRLLSRLGAVSEPDSRNEPYRLSILTKTLRSVCRFVAHRLHAGQSRSPVAGFAHWLLTFGLPASSVYDSAPTLLDYVHRTPDISTFYDAEDVDQVPAPRQVMTHLTSCSSFLLESELRCGSVYGHTPIIPKHSWVVTRYGLDYDRRFNRSVVP